MNHGPHALRRRVGITLRALRNEAGITPQQAADAIRAHPTKISRMERGEAPLRTRDVADLLDMYGMVAGDTEREALLEEVKATQRQPWWHDFRDELPPWSHIYLGIEADASNIRCYATYAIPELLQTDSYAAAFAGPEGETANCRELRAARQQLVRRPGRSLQVVLDEAAVLRMVGSPQIMQEQISCLVQAAKEPGITIQILRLASGACRRYGDVSFTFLRFCDPALSDVVYMETPTTGIYVDKPQDIDIYRERAMNLELAADPADATPSILAGLWQ